MVKVDSSRIPFEIKIVLSSEAISYLPYLKNVRTTPKATDMITKATMNNEIIHQELMLDIKNVFALSSISNISSISDDTETIIGISTKKLSDVKEALIVSFLVGLKWTVLLHITCSSFSASGTAS